MSEIYREQILDLARNPHNFGELDPHDASHQDTNPLCGDRVRIDLRIADDQIQDITFSGRGCAISQASASLLTDMVKGQPLTDAEALTKEDILDELGVDISPARLKCALLGLQVLHAAIGEYKQEQDTKADQTSI